MYKGKKYPNKVRKLGSLIKYLTKPKPSPKNFGTPKHYTVSEGPLYGNALLLRTRSTLPFKLNGQYGYYQESKWVNLNELY